MPERELEFTTRLTREDVAGLIEALVEGLKDGHLKVQKSGDVLELEVPRVVDLKIEAEIDDERAEFEIEVSWLTNRAGDPDTVPEETQSGPDVMKPQSKGAAAEKTGSGRKAPATKPRCRSGPSGPARKVLTGPGARKRPVKGGKKSGSPGRNNAVK